jgi:hypothetical protein
MHDKEINTSIQDRYPISAGWNVYYPPNCTENGWLVNYNVIYKQWELINIIDGQKIVLYRKFNSMHELITHAWPTIGIVAILFKIFVYRNANTN